MARLCQLLLLMLVNAGQAASAVEYYRCERADGSTIFSETPCAPDAKPQVIEPPRTPASDNPSRSPIDQLRDYRARVKRIDKITGTDSKPVDREQGPCSQVTSLQLRNARISRDLMRCHSVDDVEAMFGEPDSVSTWSNRKAYDTRYLYRRDRKERLSIYFKDGLVTRWNSHR